eukprot:CAMPEP_0204087830 /NCGR_PEP_ID=MMETSP0360-20130528/185332_1 /ASSEMBLY_ACC=CAM_ASM_000342 /TAXON_ID=268821 /ORGANISM="Scrippsiella Hangoei, Strain SHTV-5" /LENGTH=52 /DNA_ID=CAMNT_0051036991 /DNA_START=22 /DNA_END=177 /DNA_ORIENTATION=+
MSYVMTRVLKMSHVILFGEVGRATTCLQRPEIESPMRNISIEFGVSLYTTEF